MPSVFPFASYTRGSFIDLQPMSNPLHCFLLVVSSLFHTIVPMSMLNLHPHDLVCQLATASCSISVVTCELIDYFWFVCHSLPFLCNCNTFSFRFLCARCCLNSLCTVCIYAVPFARSRLGITTLAAYATTEPWSAGETIRKCTSWHRHTTRLGRRISN